MHVAVGRVTGWSSADRPVVPPFTGRDGRGLWPDVEDDCGLGRSAAGRHRSVPTAAPKEADAQRPDPQETLELTKPMYGTRHNAANVKPVHRIHAGHRQRSNDRVPNEIENHETEGPQPAGQRRFRWSHAR
jgi:hypothetical protein